MTDRSPGYHPGRFIYTDDTGQRYAVKVALRFGTNPALGFEPGDPSVRRIPATGIVMRYVNVVNRETGLRRKLTVGSLSAPILRTRSVEILEPALGKTLTFVVSSYIGEKKRGMA